MAGAAPRGERTLVIVQLSLVAGGSSAYATFRVQRLPPLRQRERAFRVVYAWCVQVQVHGVVVWSVGGRASGEAQAVLGMGKVVTVAASVSSGLGGGAAYRMYPRAWAR